MKTPKMLALERARKKGIKEILKESYERYGLVGSAEDLGVMPSTLYRWHRAFGLETARIPRIVEKEK